MVCRLFDVVSAETANRIPEYDIVETVQKYADQLRQECDLVIALTHIGYTEHNVGAITDPLLVSQTRGLDLVVGGHSHSYMSAPDYVPNLDGKKIPVVQVGFAGSYMGEFHISL